MSESESRRPRVRSLLTAGVAILSAAIGFLFSAAGLFPSWTKTGVIERGTAVRFLDDSYFEQLPAHPAQVYRDQTTDNLKQALSEDDYTSFWPKVDAVIDLHVRDDPQNQNRFLITWTYEYKDKHETHPTALITLRCVGSARLIPVAVKSCPVNSVRLDDVQGAPKP